MLDLALRFSYFSLINIPFGIILLAENTIPRPGVAIGNYILDLKAFPHISVFLSPSLNAFAGLGSIDIKLAYILKKNTILKQLTIILHSNIINHLPLEIDNYIDFYAGLNYTYNIRPNYKYLLIVYYERSSSIVILGTPIRRPWGSPIPILRAEDYIFSYILVNDWSINNDAILLPYLKEENKANVLNIDLEIDLMTANGQVSTISWPQMIAYHTIIGCPLRTGDLFGSGIILGISIGTEGSLLERTKGGKESLAL
ncbi:hypothetical protein BGZ63DRAFT_418004 [Mariannaea sp. PMI_226]|nr:hypothetical protein BGZ63DRAFT_418004 [Mariannaea sp. PMI_226]